MASVLLQRLALGGALGPVAFIAAWVAGAAVAGPGYSSVDDAISRLAAVDAATRPLMTAGFVAFGLALPCYALALHRALAGWAWVTAASTGLATVAVAALPLGRSAAVDRWHFVAAAVGYITLAATPLLAFGPLRSQGRTALAHAGLAVGMISAVGLTLSAVIEPDGLLQRLGLSATDGWLVASVPTVRALVLRGPRGPES